jgi:hypothetical protein
MGTVFNQIRRRDKLPYMALDEYIPYLIEVATDNNITFDQALKAAEVFHLRKMNEILLDNGDTFDEQMAGIAELLLNISNK